MVTFRSVAAATAVLCLALAVVPGTASAARFHVQLDGTRVSGPSTPDDWTSENCYSDLATASVAAAGPDTILLSNEIHSLDAPVTLTALLTNQDFAASPPPDSGLMLMSGGSLASTDLVPTIEVRGVAISSDGGTRADAALTTTPAGTVLTSLQLTGCTFTDLVRSGPGTQGGVLSALSDGNGLVIQVDQCTFTGNRTEGHGGAIFLAAGYDLRITGSSFAGNGTDDSGRGGAIAVHAAGGTGDVLIEDTEFTDNAAATVGGAVNFEGANVTLRRCNVTGSRAGVVAGATWTAGAGLRLVQDNGTVPVSLLVEDCTFTDNQGSLEVGSNAGDGGAILVQGAEGLDVDVTITGCTFTGNANAQGAGVYLSRFAVGTIAYCHFVDNTAWYQGGGVMKGGLDESVGETVTLTYCEFRGNRAGFQPDGTDTGEYSRGGAVVIRNAARADLTNCSFQDNSVNTASYAVGDAFAHPLEGGEWVPENACNIINCVFWGVGNDVQLHGEGGGFGNVSNIAAASDQIVYDATPTDPVWLTESPYTSDSDLSLPDGSLLIDAGLDVGLDHDIDGIHVPIGDAPDIGCYEAHGPVGVDDVPAARSAELAVFPNPFNPRTTLSAQLDTSADVRLAIYDTRGHRIAELWQGTLSVGTHELRWNGCDAGGRAVAAGTYMARLESDGHVLATAKLSLVR